MSNTINTTNRNTFNFKTKESAIALLLKGRAKIADLEAKMKTQEAYMSDLCQTMLAMFGTTDAETGKASLQLDLGDGSPRGHIVVQRGDLYFVRERNSGRPVGSKNRNSKAAQAAAEVVSDAQPEVVVEEPSEVARHVPSSDDGMVDLFDQEEDESATPSLTPAITGDVVVDAILATQEATLAALKEHSRSIAPAAMSAAE